MDERTAGFLLRMNAELFNILYMAAEEEAKREASQLKESNDKEG